MLAVVELPSAFGCGIGMGNGTRVILPEAEYLRYAKDGAQLPMMTAFDVNDAHMAEDEAFVRDYTENVDPTMDYRSRLTPEQEYRGLIRTFTLVGGALCGLLALIGILLHDHIRTDPGAGTGHAPICGHDWQTDEANADL